MLIGAGRDKYKEVTYLDDKPFSLNFGIRNTDMRALIHFLIKLTLGQYPSITDVNETRTYITAEWKIKIKITHMPLPWNPGILGTIVYHKYISIVLVSPDKNDEFLLFTIGAGGVESVPSETCTPVRSVSEYETIQSEPPRKPKYVISIPDKISINCIKKNNYQDDESCRKKTLAGHSPKKRVFNIMESEVVINKLIFLLLLISSGIDDKIPGFTREKDDIGVTNKWNTNQHYGIHPGKEIRSTLKLMSKSKCSSQNICKVEDYNCWHFADVMYPIITNDEYDIDLSDENTLIKSLTQWARDKHQQHHCCIIKLFITTGTKLSEKIIDVYNLHMPRRFRSLPAPPVGTALGMMKKTRKRKRKRKRGTKRK